MVRQEAHGVQQYVCLLGCERQAVADELVGARWLVEVLIPRLGFVLDAEGEAKGKAEVLLKSC